jgi:hypothetical protein
MYNKGFSRERTSIFDVNPCWIAAAAVLVLKNEGTCILSNHLFVLGRSWELLYISPECSSSDRPPTLRDLTRRSPREILCSCCASDADCRVPTNGQSVVSNALLRGSSPRDAGTTRFPRSGGGSSGLLTTRTSTTLTWRCPVTPTLSSPRSLPGA